MAFHFIENQSYCFVLMISGVRTGDSRDALGRSRFHCFNPETHLHGGYPDWYYQYDKYGAKKVCVQVLEDRVPIGNGKEYSSRIQFFRFDIPVP